MKVARTPQTSGSPDSKNKSGDHVKGGGRRQALGERVERRSVNPMLSAASRLAIWCSGYTKMM